METGIGGDEQAANLSVARGGPIYVPNLVGPLTSVSEFEAAVVNELQHLDFELSLNCSLHCEDDDLQVDELKILSEEELVDMAMKEDFKDEEKEVYSSLPTKEELNEGNEADVQISKEKSTCRKKSGRAGDVLSSLGSSSDSHSETCCNEIVNNNASMMSIQGKLHSNETAASNDSRKRKSSTANKSGITKMNANKLVADESYLRKVDELAKIKQKQDQDKQSVRLHSFNSSYKVKKTAPPSSERIQRMQTLRFTDSFYQVKSSEIHDHVDLQYPEVVLFVEVYHNIQKTKKTQEFMVLGRQMLTELRDKIYCLTDQVMDRAGHHDPSGYFLIEDMFCNDLRNPSSIDYSEPIFDWLENSRDDAMRKWEHIITGELQRKQKAIIGELTTPKLPEFWRVEMQNTRFCDLRFRLGAGYLYCHQGDCRHTIVIRDMRLIHPEDAQNRTAYPVVIFQLKYRVQKCKVCRVFRATKVTVDDKWAPENPCYFCDDCYYLLHHSEDGSLMYSDFSVYDYLHD